MSVKTESSSSSKKFAGSFFFCNRCGSLMHDHEGECSDCEKLSGFTGKGKLF